MDRSLSNPSHPDSTDNTIIYGWEVDHWDERTKSPNDTKFLPTTGVITRGSSTSAIHSDTLEPQDENRRIYDKEDLVQSKERQTTPLLWDVHQ